MPYHDIQQDLADIIADGAYEFDSHGYFLYTDKTTDEPICLAWQKEIYRSEEPLWTTHGNQPEPLLSPDQFAISSVPTKQTSQFYPLLPHVAVEAELLLRNKWNNKLIEPGGRQLFFVSYQPFIAGTTFFAYYLCSKQVFDKALGYATETLELEARWLTLTKPWASTEETLEALRFTQVYLGDYLGEVEAHG